VKTAIIKDNNLHPTQVSYHTGLLSAGILLTMLPVTMIVPVLKELVSVRFQVDTFWAHAFMSTSLLGAILFAPFAGKIIDRYPNRRWIFVLSLLGNGLCFIAMALTDSFAGLMVARFLEGAMHITALSCWLASGADSAKPGKSGRTMGALGGMIMLGITIGVPLGGFIAGDNAIGVLWYAAGISIATGIFVFLALPNKIPASPLIRKPQRLLHLLNENPLLLIPYTYSFIDRMCIGVVVSTLGLYMTDILDMSPAQRGMTLSYFLIPFSLLSYPVGKWSDKIGKIGMLAFGSLAFGILFMFYGYFASTWLTVAMVASGIVSAFMFVPTLALCKDIATTAQHGAVFAGYNIAGSLGFVVGPLFGGTLFFWFSKNSTAIEAYRHTFWISGLLEIACVIVSLPFLWKLKHRIQK
jgi:MFS family permease